MYVQINKIFLVILVLIPLQAFSQNAIKGFQLLDQQEYSDAVETFNKTLEKKKDILAAKFGLALVYSDTLYKRYRYSRAYKHIVYLEKRYVKLTDSEKSSLRKEFDIDDISIGKLRLKILTEALAEAKKEGTVESLSKFRLDFPNTEQSKEAVLGENRLAFSAAKSENNPEALIDFVRKYPNTKEVDSAKMLLAQFEEKAFKYYTSEGELSSKKVAALNSGLSLFFKMLILLQAFFYKINKIACRIISVTS